MEGVIATFTISEREIEIDQNLTCVCVCVCSRACYGHFSKQNNRPPKVSMSKSQETVHILPYMAKGALHM